MKHRLIQSTHQPFTRRRNANSTIPLYSIEQLNDRQTAWWPLLGTWEYTFLTSLPLMYHFDVSLSISLLFHFELFTARSELRKVLFLALSVTFCLRMKHLGNC